jgi:hypothetical protein
MSAAPASIACRASTLKNSAGSSLSLLGSWLWTDSTTTSAL